MHTARLLAIFEGDKNNYDCIKEVLVQLLRSAKVLANVFNFKVGLPKCASSCTEANEKQVFEIKGMQNWPMELQQLIQNPHSDHCSVFDHCKKLTGSKRETPASQSSDGTCTVSAVFLNAG